jgi:glutamate synthase domain-containing protein 2
MSNLTRDKILTFFIAWVLILGFASYYFQSPILWVLATIFAVGLVVIIHDIIQTKHALLRNYPLLGRIRWVFEHERSKIQQYFIEHDTNGTPYNREKRSDVYQKSKGEVNTTPFGTQLDVYKEGYEFLGHSMYPKDISEVLEPRVTIGGSDCRKPYSASIFNISAMSYGALSDAAVRALTGGAKLGGFYHNTGEGGVSPYHLQGGDLCFQIGTGYFGAGKTIDGKRIFDEATFIKTIKASTIKMVEVKLSQGAKPGHGGILPASKNTQEIADIRGVEPHVDVMSPPYHSAFSNPKELLYFINDLRNLSKGLPIGIKLCLGDKSEFHSLCFHMKVLKIYPDFITIDGGEGGTGAAPIVFTNNVGMPLVDALIFVNQTLIRYDLRDKITIIASGKASNSFDIVKLLALGADVVNAARAFMLSLGCIQARECNMNTCPVGIATQNKTLIGALNPAEKKVRVYNYHKAVIREVRELLGAMGLTNIDQLTSEHIMHRDENSKLKNY